MKKMNLKEILIPTIALFVICLVATALLAFTNSATQDKIAQNAIQTENASRKIVLPSGASFSEVEALDDVSYCIGSDETGNEVGYVFTSGAKGYGGTVSVMVGVDLEGNITGVEILSHSETPGLGANAVKQDYKDRFVGKNGTLTVDKTSNEGQNVQAITAATITSKAVVAAVNSALEAFAKLQEV